MCLAAFALNAHPRFRLVIAANRDEFFARPAAPMAWWADHPAILAGRDLSAGGTWFGLTRAGRLALLTNVREPGRQNADAPTRGALVVGWLTSRLAATDFANALKPGYNGFNLITADLTQNAWHWISNRAQSPLALPDGIHGLSNAALDTPWPKTLGLKAALADALAAAGTAEQLIEQLFDALADRAIPPDASLPDTGVGIERERLLAYGTRCATVLVREANGVTRVIERSAGADGRWTSQVAHELAGWPGAQATGRDTFAQTAL